MSGRIAFASTSSHLVSNAINYARLRWQQDKYCPLASEAYGISQIVSGTLLTLIGGGVWINDCCRGNTLEDSDFFLWALTSPKAIIFTGAWQIANGINHAKMIPIAYGIYQLAKYSLY